MFDFDSFDFNSPSLGQPGYLPYCGRCPRLVRMVRTETCFKCPSCGLETTRINGEEMFEKTAPQPKIE